MHPLPGTAGTLLPALVHPPLFPRGCASAPSRIAPTAAARSAGRSPRAWPPPPTTLRRLGPFDPAVHLFAEDIELGLRARAARDPDRPASRRADPPHRRARDAPPRRAVRRARPAPSRGDRRARSARTSLAVDDLAQALTFATRAAGHAVLGGDAARPRAQLAALRRARWPASHTGRPRGRRSGGRAARRTRVRTVNGWPSRVVGVVAKGQTWLNLVYVLIGFAARPGVLRRADRRAVGVGIALAVLVIGLGILLATLAAWRAFAAVERATRPRAARGADPGIRRSIAATCRSSTACGAGLRDPVTVEEGLVFVAL